MAYLPSVEGTLLIVLPKAFPRPGKVLFDYRKAAGSLYLDPNIFVRVRKDTEGLDIQLFASTLVDVYGNDIAQT
jgi:hypothetical protein